MMPTPRLAAVISAHALLRVLSSAGAILVGIDLAQAGGVTRPGVVLIGVLGAGAYGAELLASLPLGVAADAIPVRLLMAAGALLSALALQLFISVSSFPGMLFSRLLAGIGVAAVTPPLLQLLAQLSREDAAVRARLMSYFELSMLAGLALGGLAGAQLWAQLRTGAFTAGAALCLVCAVALFAGTGATRGVGARAALRGLGAALRDRSVRELLPAWLCVNAVIGLWLGPTLSYLLTEPRGGPVPTGQYLVGRFAGASADLGWMLLGYAAVFGLGVGGWSVLLARTDVRSVLRVSLLAMLAVCAALFAFNHCGQCTAAARWGIGTLAALLIMVESGFTPAALSWLAGSLQRQSGRGAAMGIYSLLFSLGALGGSLLAGVLGRLWRVDGLLLGTALLAVTALLLLPRTALVRALPVAR